MDSIPARTLQKSSLAGENIRLSHSPASFAIRKAEQFSSGYKNMERKRQELTQEAAGKPEIGGPGIFDTRTRQLIDSKWLFLSGVCVLPALAQRPRRLARPRTPPFHGDNTGSNPVGDAKENKRFRVNQARQPNHSEALSTFHARRFFCRSKTGHSQSSESHLLEPWLSKLDCRAWF